MTDLTLTAPIFPRLMACCFLHMVLTVAIACSLSFEAACKRLGAAGQRGAEMLLAFKLNHPRILRAIVD
ncbi:protein of unknown function (plasmid) [Pararobbsia alpina]